ncbi:MAG: hypothetical protein J2O44_04170 [Porphyrobacter sp.]|nr:hypothetical protein [Porphyrobacter sp.]
MRPTLLLPIALIAAPLQAQSVGGNAAGQPAPVTPVPTIQPSASSGQVGRAPANSAMRQAGEGGSAAAQPQAGGGSTPTNAMTLTLGGGAGNGSQARGASGSSNQGMRNGSQRGSSETPTTGQGASSSGQQAPSYDATGILRAGGSP